MQILYGITVSDRVSVIQTAPNVFQGYFDGTLVERAGNGAACVHAVKRYLAQRREQRAAADHKNQVAEDDAFLDDLTQKIGLDRSDLDTLLDIFKRRIT